MSGRVLRIASMPLAGTGLMGLGLRVALAMHRGGSHDDRRVAMIAAIVSTAALAAAWFLERVQVWRGERAAQMEARRAVLLAHADPVVARVDEHTDRLDRHDAKFRAYDHRISALVEAMSDRLAKAGVSVPDKEKTAPMMRIVGGKKDSA